MLLEINLAIFDAPDHEPVIKVLTMVAKQRHDWHPDMAHALRAERFVAKLTTAELRFPVLTEWATKAVVEAAYPRADDRRQVQVTLGELDRTVADLEQAAVLVLENRLGDGAFVRRLATAFGDQRIVAALDKKWLRLSHGGGCSQMPALTAEECKSFAVVIRVAAIYDSDRTRHGESSPNQRKVRQTRETGAEVHLLAWRMMENYLPFRVWEHHFSTEMHKVSQIRAMVPQRRGYMHLKHHFVGRDGRMPAPLIPDGIDLAEADFAELGPDVVPELRELLAMIQRIL